MDSRSSAAYFAQVTVSSAAKSLTSVTGGFTAAQVAAASRLWISVDVGALRLTWDSAQTTPTTTKGMLITNKNYPLFELVGNTNITNLQMIRDGNADATVNLLIENQ